MALTDKGRFVFGGLTERGKFVNGNLTDNGLPIFNIVAIPVNPTYPPNVTIVSVDHYTISNQSDMNFADVTFYFDSDVTSWTINVMGVSNDTGTLVASGGSVNANQNITATVYANQMYEEGYNKINLYGQNALGWTPYETDQNEPKVYYLSMNGTSDYLTIPPFDMTHIVMDVYIDSNQPTGSFNDGSLRNGQTSEHVLLDDQNRDANTGYLWIYDGTYMNGISTSWSSVQVNGNIITDYGQIPFGQRMIVDALAKNTAKGLMSVFAHNTLSDGFMKGYLYDIKIYNNTEIVAWYDFTKGNVEDQTGNGNDATLNGGTWIQVD